MALFNKKEGEGTGGFGERKSSFNFSRGAERNNASPMKDVVSKQGNVIKLEKPLKKSGPSFPPMLSPLSSRPVVKPDRVPAFLNKETTPAQDRIIMTDRFLPKAPGEKMPSRRIRIIVIGIAAVLFLALGAGVSFLLLKAVVSIQTKITTVPITPVKMIVDSKTQTPNFASKRLPGLYIEETKTVTKSFEAKTVGYTESRARGHITIYNEFGTSPQVLIKTTRFESKSTGLIFRIQETVTVPGATKDGDRLIPGSVRAEVLADEVGEKYNIGADDFTIPAFRGSPRYQGFYAKSVEQFQGGLKGAGAMVTAEELQKAEEAVTAEVFELAKKELQGKVPPGFILRSGASSMRIDNINKPRVGEAVKTYTVSADAIASAELFKEDDLYFLLSRLFLKEGTNEAIIKEKTDLEYPEIDFDPESHILTFTLGGNVVVTSVVDEAGLKNELAGKSRSEAETILNSKPEIVGHTLTISPFWINRTPSDPERVEIKVEL